MGLERVTLRFSFALVIISTVLMSCATSDSDQNECTPQLVGLATCLPYVGGTAKSPTPDCCNGLKQVLKTNKKCLCVVVKDRNDPNLGLSINATLALGLPSVCHAPANISQCPGKFIPFLFNSLIGGDAKMTTSCVNVLIVVTQNFFIWLQILPMLRFSINLVTAPALLRVAQFQALKLIQQVPIAPPEQRRLLQRKARELGKDGWI